MRADGAPARRPPAPTVARDDSERSQDAMTMTTERVPMTRESYEKLKAELERMQTTDMIEITKKVAEARSHGDLSENAEYHAAREDQGMLQARIDRAKDRLARAT